MDRREMLIASCTVFSIGLAGCSSDDDNEDDGGDSNTPGGDDQGTPDDGETPGDEGTPGDGGNRSNPSTEGNDDEPLEGPAEDLLGLTEDDLPEGEWQPEVDSDIAPDSDAVAGFKQESPLVQVVSSVDLYESVSEAESDYESTRDELVGGSEDSETVESLDIASESFRALDGTFVLFRDANAIGSVLIQGSGDTFDSLSTADLAAAMHRRWRDA